MAHNAVVTLGALHSAVWRFVPVDSVVAFQESIRCPCGLGRHRPARSIVRVARDPPKAHFGPTFRRGLVAHGRLHRRERFSAKLQGSLFDSTVHRAIVSAHGSVSGKRLYVIDHSRLRRASARFESEIEPL
jgi:hypothetical protein